MKNKKWLTYTLSALLTLVVLAAVAGAGFHAGSTQNASFANMAFAHHFDSNLQGSPEKGFSHNDSFGGMQDQGFGRHDSHHTGRGFMPFFSPIFGLIHLALLGLIFWGAYKWVKNSGWKLIRETASVMPAVNESPSVEVAEKTKSKK